MSTHLIVPDNHSHFEHHNERATWLSKLIIDIRPDVVVFIGDSADMPSLSGYDKGKKTFAGRTYRADINSHLDFQDRVWSPIKDRKKRLPRRVFCIGNHEDRITRAINTQPELDGAISLTDLQLEDYYDDIIFYSGQSTPGTITIDGVTYAHYLVSGISGRPISAEHPAYNLLAKNFTSCTVGHSHLLDYSIRTSLSGSRLHGLVSGCYVDYNMDWAGESQNFWWRGVVVKRNVEDGSYDPQFISIENIRKEYSV